MVTPYTIDIPDERLAAIMAKIEAYDWSQLPDAGGWRSGVGINDLKRLVTYWQDSYDWRKVERRLNQLPNFMTDLDINMVSILAEDVTPTTPEEKDLISRRNAILDWETGYNHEQETRPQTLGVAMADSPVGAAGWILEKFGQWADLTKRVDGSPNIWSKFSEEELLTNIMLYVAPLSVVTATLSGERP